MAKPSTVLRGPRRQVGLADQPRSEVHDQRSALSVGNGAQLKGSSCSMMPGLISKKPLSSPLPSLTGPWSICAEGW